VAAGKKDITNKGFTAFRLTLIYALIASFWIVFSGYLLQVSFEDPVTQWRMEMAKGLAFVMVTSVFLYLLLLRRVEPVSSLGGKAAVRGYGIGTVIIALLLMVPLAGYGILRLYSPSLEAQIYADLEAVATLKMGQVELWHNERMNDLSVLTTSESFVANVANFRRNNDSAAGDSIRSQLATVAKAYNYSSLQLLSPEGLPLIAVGDEVALPAETRKLVARVRMAGLSAHGELFLNHRGRARIDYAGFIAAADGGGAPLAIVLLRSNPNNHLLPLIHAWPGERLGTETLLVRGEGNSVVFLTLASSDGKKPFLRLPLHSQELVAATAVKSGVAGQIQGLDYRGTPVFAAYSPVKNTGWFVIAKVDRDVALAPLRQLAAWISFIVFVAAILVSSLLLLLWRQQQRTYQFGLMTQAVEHERKLREQEAVYHEMFDGNPNPMWVYDANSLRFLAVNDAAVTHYGYSRDEFLLMTLSDIRPPEDSSRLSRYVASLSSHNIAAGGIWKHQKRDGSLIDVEISSHGLNFNNRPARLVLAYDVTERERTEAQLRESDRFARATLDAVVLHIAVLDENGAIIATNKAWRNFSAQNGGALQTTGIGANYIQATRAAAAAGNQTAMDLLPNLEALIGGKIDSFQFEYPCHSPTEKRWFIAHVSRFPDDGVLRIVISHENITGRKMAELELLKLNRYYAALSAMNAAIVRTREPQQILDQVCRIAVDQGELELVWVGRLESDHRHITRAASYGRASGYLDQVTISADPDDISGLGPVGISVREGRSVVVNDFSRDESTRPWHEPARHWGLKAILVCPIHRRDHIWGEIAFYANQPDYFSPDLVNLMEKLTEDLAYSLDMVDMERSRAEAEAQLLLNARIIESSHEGLFITDSDHRYTMVNRAFCTITGYNSDELIGNKMNLLSSGRQEPGFYQQLQTSLAHSGRWEGELWDRRKDGEIYPASLSITRVDGSEAGSYQHIAIYRDITERKAYESKIEHIASHDILTDLPNRVLLADRISVAIAHAARSGGQLALLFVDLDRFKLVNDTLGHDFGDLLLKEIARRITAALRSADTVSRVGGDEFVVLLQDIGSAEDAARVAEKIIRSIKQPFDINGHRLIVTASVGVAMYPDNGQDAQGLTVLADLAMRAAKQSGNNRYQFYSHELGANASERLTMENELRSAIDRGEIFVAYQPQCSLDDGRIVGIEALARWQHPAYGLVSPLQFIPIAEESGLILDIGAWITHEVCRQAQAWRQAGIVDVPVSVNVSALQFQQADFVSNIESALTATGLPATQLELEVTESVLMTGIDEVLEKLNNLHAGGIKLAIDDFGTGYSSLSYLRQLPAQRLKIDQSFIRDLPASQDAASIARAIVSLASSLGMKTVAEGVETQAQVDFLRSISCSVGQGYLYAKPMTSSDFEVWIKSWSGFSAAEE